MMRCSEIREAQRQLTRAKTRFVAATVLAFILCGGDRVCGTDYPNKPLRLVTAEVGGGSDFVARLVAVPLSAALGQQVIVDDRPSMAPEIVAKARPDGYTLLLYGSALWTLPLMRAHVGYDPLRDFAAVSLVASTPNILAVNPAVAVNTVPDLIALAQAKPGQLNYASGAAGSPNHIAGELFKALARVNIVRIPYKGSGPALNALIGGQVELAFAPAASAMLHARNGRLRALAVTSAEPSALAPGVPTVAGAGLPGYESVAIYGLFAPTGTSAALVSRLNKEIVLVVQRTDIRERLINAGFEAVGSTPATLASARIADLTRVGKVIRDAGIRED